MVRKAFTPVYATPAVGAFSLIFLLVLVVLLSGCGRSEPVVTAVVLPEGWQTVEEPEFRLALPPTWEVLSAEDGDIAGALDDLIRENPRLQNTAAQAQAAVASGQIKLLAFDVDPEELLPNFTTNLSIGQHALEQPAALDAVIDANERALQEAGFTDIQRTMIKIGADDAARLQSTLALTDAAGEALILSMQQVILVQPEHQYILTFATTTGQQPRMQPIYDQIVGTFRIG